MAGYKDMTREEAEAARAETREVGERWAKFVAGMTLEEAQAKLMEARRNLKNFTVRTLMGEKPWEDEESAE